MCGIVGFLQCQNRHEFSNCLSEAVSALSHRGPDAFGIWTNQNQIGLGHRRLSILDLSELGHQPMKSSCGRYIIVFNGEVYNFNDIRKKLIALGYSFKGHSDTEVIISAFSEWGKDCVKKFVGMFALAIWDKSEQTICLCRDRMGIKPLYYGWDGSCLWFASELKALRKFKHWKPKVDRNSLGEFFQYSYIGGNRSIYENISKLPAASWLELNVQDSKPIITRYWHPEEAFSKKVLDITEQEIMEQLEVIMAESFSQRLISDVPIGVFLSGGIDSTLLTAILTQKAKRQVKTFTLGFSEPKFDESKWAKKIANHLGTDHTEYILSASEASNIVEQLPTMYDEPFGDSSSIPTYMISKLSRQDVTVILSSDGGDELFGGYDYYNSIPRLGRQINQVPNFLKGLLGSFSKRLSISALNSLANNFSRYDLKKLARNIIQMTNIFQDYDNQYRLFSTMRSYWPEQIVSKLLGKYSDPRIELEQVAKKMQIEERMMFWDLKNYMTDDILVKMDRSSMAVSLEGRVPLLDHRIIEYALKIPLKYKLGKLGNKHLLKKILYKYVPREFVDRPKQGFSIPMEDWRTDSLGELIKEEISDFIYDNRYDFNKKLIEKELAFYSSSSGNEHQMWLLYSFVKWYKMWM